MATSVITINQGETIITQGNVGPQGIPGEGVPAGGTTGQILSKASNTNYDDVWIDNFTSDVRQQVKNDSGGTLAKGTAVYVSGANGTNVLVKAALANSDTTSATTMGLLFQSLAANGIGYVITEGTLSGVDTSTAAAGDPVWLSGTVAGGLLFGWANEPKAPTHIVYLGTVSRSHATLGEVLVTIRNGWELDELHNVLITSPTNGQVLAYDSATGLWKNTTDTGDISAVSVTSPITGGGTSGNVTIAIQDATTAQKGAVQLTDSTASTSTTTAATPNSVKSAYDLAAAAAPQTRTLTAGTGLTGGGTLAADRTFTLDPNVVSYDASSSLRSLPLYNQKDAAEKLLAQAVWWIDAAHSSASGQTITNLGWGGSALNATAGSSGSADSNDPKFLDWTGTNYTYLPGAASNYLSIPTSTALNITGDIDIRAYVALDDWTPATEQSICGSLSSDPERKFRFNVATDGKLAFYWFPLGTAASGIVKFSTVSTGVTDGAAKWVRVTLDVDNGASGNTVTFYTSDDGSTWTQLGSTVTTAGTTAIASTTVPYEIGSSGFSGANFPLAGKVYAAQILNGIGGTVVLNVDTSVITSGAATSFTALTGQTVTVNRATSGRRTVVVTNPLWLFGTDDYINTPDNDLLDFAATESFTELAVFRMPSVTANGRILSKRPTGTAGWETFAASSGNTLDALVGDGTNYATGGNLQRAITPGALLNFALVINRTANTALTALNGSFGTTTSISTVGSTATTAPLSTGRTTVGGGGSYADMEGFAFAVWRRNLTADELTLLANYYAGRIA